jgi:ribonuclease G
VEQAREESQEAPAEPDEPRAPAGDGEASMETPVHTPTATASPTEFVEAVEQWITEHRDQHRSVTLRVHPFTAAFLRRPVPTYPTRWFMDHLVRVHLETDEDLAPLSFRVVDTQGELLTESS